MASSAELLDVQVVSNRLARPVSTVAASLAPSAVRLRYALRTIALSLGGLAGWSSRHSMNVDGVSYLDMGDAFMRGDWTQAINGHWSPLYAWVQGFALAVVQPSNYWEFTLAHAVNFIVFLGALAAFEFLLTELLAYNRACERHDGRSTLPEWAWLVLGYALFLWSSLQLITISLITPDLAVAGFVYLSAGLILRIRRRAASRKTFAVLGSVLALGYLTKAPMFPMALIFLGVGALAAKPTRQALLSVGLAAGMFAVVATPYVIALSVQKGHVTIGESSTISYGWFVTQIPFRHWQGSDPDVLLHPTRRVFENPAVYEFASPIGGTYPVWYDPSYWHAGTRLHFDLRQELRALVESARQLYGIFLVYLQSALVVGFLSLALANCSVRRTLRDLAEEWPLIVPALAGLAMFAVVAALPRYVAPFVVLLWIGLFSGIRLPATDESRRFLSACCIVMILMMAAVIAVSVGPSAYSGARDLLKGEASSANPQWVVAEHLRSLGLRSGDAVAEVHPPPKLASWSGMTSWARLARVRIVAEVPPEASDAYWTALPERQREVMRVFTKTGARAVVTVNIPPERLGEGWLRLGHTNYYAYRLTP